MGDPVTVATAIGFSAIGLLPALLVAAAALRGLWAGWRPRQLGAALIEDGGGAPRLLAWLLFLVLAAVVLVWSTFNGVRILAVTTSFKPVVVSLAMPIIAVTAAVLCAAVSRPAVDALAAILRRLDRRVVRRRRRSPMAPRWLAVYAAALVAALLAVAWRVVISPRIGDLALGAAASPLAAIAVAAAGHLAWSHLGRRPRPTALIAATAAAGALIGCALWSRATDAGRVLAVWGNTAVAGVIVEQLYDLDRVHDDIPIEQLRPVERPGAAHPDIILVTIDTVRADRTPLGGGTVAMPALSKLGARGAVFEWAFAPGNVTRRSLPTIALGVSPTRVRGRVAGWALRLDPRHVVVAERLRAGGYDTAGFFCCGSFWGAEHRLGLNRGLDHLHIQQPGAALAGSARAWLDARDRSPTRRPLFVWIHFIEPHNWTAVDDAARGSDGPRGSDARRKLYDESLARVDGFLGEVVAAFDDRPADRQPIVVVTADHGEGLGDHGVPYHSSGLHNAQLRVPLVIAGPGITSRRITEPVGLGSLAATLLDLAGFVPPSAPLMDGRSLADLATGTRDPAPDAGYAFAAQIRDRSVASDIRMVVEGRWKLIAGPDRVELFDIRSDPGEMRDLSRTQPERLAHMKRLLLSRSALDAISPFP
jgi:arylsulfatase A-like enzyme